jgi:hypothetical protein
MSLEGIRTGTSSTSNNPASSQNNPASSSLASSPAKNLRKDSPVNRSKTQISEDAPDLFGPESSRLRLSLGRPYYRLLLNAFSTLLAAASAISLSASACSRKPAATAFVAAALTAATYPS